MKLSRMFILLTGLSLVACTSVDTPPSKTDVAPSKGEALAPKMSVAPEIVTVSKQTASLSKTSIGPKTRIVVVVNKDVITAGDVDERVRLINLSAGKPVSTPIPDDIRKQIIQGMVEESLQLQAAKSKKIKVDDADVEKALESLAKDNKMSLEAMVKMLRTNAVTGLNLDPSTKNTPCEGCIFGKSCRTPFCSSTTKSDGVGHIIHSDIGEVPIPTPNNEVYYVVFKDDFSNWTSIVCMKRKSDATKLLMKFIAFVKRATGRDVRIVRTDGGKEYDNDAINNFFTAEGIVHQTTVPQSYSDGICP